MPIHAKVDIYAEARSRVVSTGSRDSQSPGDLADIEGASLSSGRILLEPLARLAPTKQIPYKTSMEQN